MGWTHATIDGLTIHELVCETQSNLIRGVNERLELLGMSPLYFYYGDGTVTKRYPTAADFDGFPLLGGDVAISAPLLDNLTKIQDFITGTAPNWFVTTRTGSTFWTATTLAAAVGLGPFPSLASGWDFRDATLWQRMQDALDLLLYVKRYVMYGVDVQSQSYVRSSSTGTYEQAWDAAKVATPSVRPEPLVANPSTDINTGWKMGWDDGKVELWGPTTLTVYSPVTGPASSMVVRVEKQWFDMDMEVEYSIEGETFSTGTGEGQDEEDISITPNFDASGYMDVELIVSTSEPANMPWTPTYVSASGWFSGYNLGTLARVVAAPEDTAGMNYSASYVTYDLSSELTDQS